MLVKDIWTNKKYTYIWLTIGAFLYTLAIQAFMQNAKSFSAGVGAISSLFTYIIDGAASYFSIIYVIANIPLVLFFYKKVKRKFMYKTIFYILIQGAFGSIFLVPEVSDIFKHVLVVKGVLKENVRDLGWPILVLSIFGGVLAGFATGIAWKAGGSGGGIDIVTYYLSTKRKKPIGLFMSITSYIALLISFVISMSINAEIREQWLMTLASSMIYVGIFSIIVDRLYPKYSKIKLQIHSSHIKEISAYLKEINFNHSFTELTYKSSYTGTNQKYISTVVLILEVKNLLKQLRKIDPNVWVSATRVRAIFGNYSTQSVDEH